MSLSNVNFRPWAQERKERNEWITVHGFEPEERMYSYLFFPSSKLLYIILYEDEPLPMGGYFSKSSSRAGSRQRIHAVESASRKADLLEF